MPYRPSEPPSQAATTVWTIRWDLHRRPGTEGWSRAIEQTEQEALQRAERFLRLGFVVYAIIGPDGAVVMDESQITNRFAPAPREVEPQPEAMPKVSAKTLF
jgi:hypothetical protein